MLKQHKNLELVGHMDWDDVAEKPLRLVSHCLDLGTVLVSLHVAMVMETVTDFKLPIEKPDQKKE